jgi:hypothetical protein
MAAAATVTSQVLIHILISTLTCGRNQEVDYVFYAKKGKHLLATLFNSMEGTGSIAHVLSIAAIRRALLW